jgi:methyl-accepting chemotaxis protein
VREQFDEIFDHPIRMTGRVGAFTSLVFVRSLALVVVVALGLVAAGCGSKSSQPMSTADWANGMCSAITTWKSSIKSSTDSLKSGNLSQDSLKTTAGDMKSATETLESGLRDLGKPDTQAGQQAKDSVDQLSSELKTDTDSIKSAADGISDVSSARTAAASISTTVATMGNQVSSTVTSLKQLDPKGELKTAFQQSSSCTQLSSSSS